MPSTTPESSPDLIYDVGMHLGEDSAYYLAKGYRVVAFEANPDLVEKGHLRFASEIDAGRMRIVAGAISGSSEGTETFYLHANSVWGTTDEEWADRNRWLGQSKPVEVPRVDLTAVMAETGVPLYAKIDIEGADKLCLSTVASGASKPGFVSLESEKADWSALVAEFDLLESLGYTRFAVVQQAGMAGRRVKTRTIDGSVLDYQFEEHSSGAFGDDLPTWVSRAEALKRYRRIFAGYRLLGDQARIRRNRLGRALRGRLDQLSPVPLPGWYDTHARR